LIECGGTKDFKYSAGCFVRLAELATGGMPSVDTKMNAKCFGGPDNTPGGGSAGPSADYPAPDTSTEIKFGVDSAKTSTIWTAA